jgi:site-specific recombinase XerD
MTTTYKPELNNKPKADGTYLVLIRLTENRKIKRVSTGVFINQNDWFEFETAKAKSTRIKKNLKESDKTKHLKKPQAKFGAWVKKSNPSASYLNNEIEKTIKDLKESKAKLEKLNHLANPKGIISEFKNNNAASFSAYYKTFVDDAQYINSIGYYKHLLSKYNNLEAYQKDILFSEVTSSFIDKYKLHLAKKGLNQNSIISNLRAIRTVLYKAYRLDKYEGKNPFLQNPLQEIKGNKSRLTIEDIKKLESLELEPNSKIWHTRNFFLFSFYSAGMRISDLISLKWSNIKGKELNYIMGKTNNTTKIDLIEKALNILEHYKSNKKYIFPILDESALKLSPENLYKLKQSKAALINRNLKDLADIAEIEINLTSHISRHSYADILREKKVSIYDIMNLLGHSDIKITQRYLAGFDNKASNEAHNSAMEF